MHKYRMLFKKTGRAIYISHLDLMRVMQRTFMRAGYQLKYSEGFNPHPQISILLPLSVGCSSQCELMDFQILGDEDISAMPVRLTAVMPEGIEVLSVYETESKVKNLKYLRIGGVFEYDERDCGEMQTKLTEFFSRGNIVIEKKTKRGMGESDIKPAISEISFAAGEGVVNLEAVISAQEPTLNPEHLVSALRQLAPESAPDFAEFIRLEVFDEKMEIFR